MAEEKKSGIGILVGFIAALTIFLTSLVAFGITGDVAFYIIAIEDDSLWTDELKYVSTAPADIANASASSNTYEVDDTNVKDVYEAAQDTRVDTIANVRLGVTAANLIVTLVSLVVVVVLFFRKPDGILAMLTGMNK